MKIVILAGGLGTRLEEETVLIPKPMVLIGSQPILVHIMKIYSYYGFNDFVICLGYKGDIIKEYFANYFLYNSNVTFDFSSGKNNYRFHSKKAKPWKVTLVDTGLDTQTGGRLKKIRPFIKDKTFMLTYGDGLADINIKNLLNFHYSHKKLATVSAVQPSGRFGVMRIGKKNKVLSFSEKPAGEGGWINGGFFVLDRKVFNYIKNDEIIWEREPLLKLANDNQLTAYHHSGFWKCMDTLRDKNNLVQLWNSKKAPWKVWKSDKKKNEK